MLTLWIKQQLIFKGSADMGCNAWSQLGSWMLGATLCVASAAQAQQALPLYKVSSTLALPSGAAYIETLSINNAGQVAGFTHQSAGGSPTIGSVEIWFGISFPTLSSSSKDKIQPALWTNGKPTLLPRYMGLYNALAYQVADNGWVVGGAARSSSMASNKLYQAALWRDGKMVDLKAGDRSALLPGSVSINASGVVLAYSTTQQRPFLWRNGVVENLPAQVGDSGAKLAPLGLTDGGQVLLGSADRGLFLWSAGQLSQVPVPAGQLLVSARISSNGWVAGTVNSVDDPYGRQSAFLFKDGVWRWMPMSAEMTLVNGTVQRVVAVADGGAVLLSWQAYNASKEVSMLWKGDAIGPVEALLPTGTSVMPGGASAGVEVYDMNDKGQILAQIVSSGSKRVILSPVLP